MKLDEAKAILVECRKRYDDHIAECTECGKYTYCLVGKKLKIRLNDQSTVVRTALRRAEYRNGSRDHVT